MSSDNAEIIDNTILFVLLRTEVIYSMIKFNLINRRFDIYKIPDIPYSQINTNPGVISAAPPDYSINIPHVPQSRQQCIDQLCTQILFNDKRSASCKFTKNDKIVEVFNQNKLLSSTQVVSFPILNAIILNSFIIEFYCIQEITKQAPETNIKIFVNSKIDGIKKLLIFTNILSFTDISNFMEIIYLLTKAIE